MKRYQETLYDAYGQEFLVDKIYFENKTDHQHLVIFENSMFGRVMALDGVIQTTEADEFIYHEMLTHVPIISHGSVKDVLIIGGGDGGMLREVCKHQTVERVTQVEIDSQVIDMCRQYLPNHSNGSYDDNRVTIEIDDGANFVRETEKKFDIIISDSTDPIGPGEALFTSSFYEDCKKCLNDGGILVTQNGVAFMQRDEVITTHNRFNSYFSDCYFYGAAVPTYIGGIMTFAWGTDNQELRNQKLEVIQERYTNSKISTKYYNPEIHLAAFALPQYIKDFLKV